jgi:hypothetical protein
MCVFFEKDTAGDEEEKESAEEAKAVGNTAGGDKDKFAESNMSKE